ncbi:MAG: hypothetical protein JWQ18_3224, partial [Conexibacter sp.]|nr:hypothetical protein [Conexibacter sp.]
MTHRRLTSAQRGIWFAQQLDPTSPAFVTADVIEVEAEAGTAAARLAASVAAALADAEGLHARFGEGDDGEPWQELCPPSVSVPVVDVVDAAAAEVWMAADLTHPIDLTTGALSRQALLRHADGHLWWYQAIHHLATDAYATSLILRRAAEHHAGETTSPFGTLADLADLADLDDLDAAYATSETHDHDRTFWSAELAGLTTAPTIAAAAPPLAAIP